MPARTPAIALPPRFRLGALIATGGMGGVWAAEDDTLGRPVAIKILAEHLAADPRYRARFAREARAAARVSAHPNIVTIYDVGEVEQRSYLVMELMEGGDLGARLREGRPATEDALAWLAGAAAGLDHGHAQGVVHRDVKPGNLLLDAAGRVAVADFGIARLDTEHTLTASGELLGTAAYLAPEQLLGERATAVGDVYALAVVAFELLTGGRPFTGPHLAAHARQQVEAAPPRASGRSPGLPPELDDVLARGLARDPAARPPTCDALVQAIAGALRRPAPEPSRPVLVHRRRRRGPAVLAVLALALVAGLLANVLGGGGSGGGTGTTAVRRPAATTHARAAAKRVPVASTPTAGPTPATTTPTTPPAHAAPAAPSAEQLEANGHALLTQGRTGAAVPVLQRALRATGESTDRCLRPAGACLTYAFALFDLGHALRLSGQRDAALATLRDRLRIDNQRPEVLREMAAALGGGATGPHGAPGPRGGPGRHHDHRHD